MKTIEVAEAILINNEGEILLQLRDNKDSIWGGGNWGLIGGGKKKNESFSECIIREIKEEIGISIDNLELLDIVDDKENDTLFRHQIFFGVININSCDIELKEGEEINFFTIDGIRDISTVPWFHNVYTDSIKKLKALKKSNNI